MRKLFLIALITVLLLNSNLYAGWFGLQTGSNSYLTSIFFNNASTGYVGGLNGYIAKTTDGGASWIQQNSLMNTQFVRAISFVDLNTGFICGDDGQIRKSTDGGTTWIPQFSNTVAGIYCIEAVDANNVYAAVNNGTVLRSTDGGNTYFSVAVSPNQLLTLDFVSIDTGFAAGQGGVVYKTTNAGLNWTFLNASTLNNFWDICALSGSDLYLAAYYGTLRKSENTGGSFTPAYAYNLNYEDIHMVNSMIGYACALDGYIVKTTDGGLTWKNQISGSTENLNEIFFVDSKTGYIACTAGTVLKTTDGGDNFNLAVISPNNGEVLISGSTSVIQWASTVSGNVNIEFSTNDGGNWNTIQNSVPANNFSFNWQVPSANSNTCKVKITSVENPSITDISDGKFAIVHVNPFYNVPELIYYKFNDGINSTPNYAVPGQIYGDADINGMSLQNGGLADSSLVGQGGNGLTNLVSTNWATNFPSSGFTIGFWVSNISLGTDPNNAVYLFADVTANNVRCYYGGAQGLTGQDTAIMFRCGGMADVRIPVIQGQTYYIHIVFDPSVSQLRVFVNGTLTQTIPQGNVLAIGNGPLKIGASANFSSSLANGMRLDEFRVYSRPLEENEIAATWNITFPAVITGIQNEEVFLRSDYMLFDNYPNPFNPETIIRYTLKEKGFTTLKIYNALGKEVSQLIGEFQNSGNHSIRFNASDLSAGVYYYRLESGSFREAKKMVLIK